MSECPNLTEDGRCLVVLDLARGYGSEGGRTNEAACSKCSGSTPARDANAVTASLAMFNVRKDEGAVPPEMLTELGPLLRRERPSAEKGPGTELARILSWFATDEEGCRCRSRARIMNVWGPSTCRRRSDTILEWLREEAGRRGLPFVRVVAQVWIARAIRRSERS